MKNWHTHTHKILQNISFSVPFLPNRQFLFCHSYTFKTSYIYFFTCTNAIEWFLVNTTRLVIGDWIRIAMLRFASPMSLRRERWSAARRSAGEGKLLFNPSRLRQDATSRFHLAVAINDSVHSVDSNQDEIRSWTLFIDLFSSERQRTPRSWIGKSSYSSTCFDLSSLSTYSFRQEVRISGYFVQCWSFRALSRFYNVGFYC